MPRQTIAVDIDDVLAINVPNFLDYTNKKYGTNLTAADYDEDWVKMWGIDHEESRRRGADLHSSGLLATHKHFEDAEAVLQKLSKKYHLVITTSRRLSVQDLTLEWIDKHFGDIFEDVHFAGIWDAITEHSSMATKAELCKEIGADFLIDDQIKHCQAVASAGLKGLLFGDYPWNRAEKLPAGVTRVKDWQAVEEYFDGLQ